jgi:hypothetical protein
MKRAVWIAMGLGTMISGAAAIGIDVQSTPAPAPSSYLERTALLDAARRAQRDVIEARYQSDRSACENLGGARRDNCFIDAHARKGRALLETAAPYATRS